MSLVINAPVTYFSTGFFAKADYPYTFSGNSKSIQSPSLFFSKGIYVSNSSKAFYRDSFDGFTVPPILFGRGLYVNQRQFLKTFSGRMFEIAVFAEDGIDDAILFSTSRELIRQIPISMSILPSATAKCTFLRLSKGEVTPIGAEFLFNNWKNQNN